MVKYQQGDGFRVINRRGCADCALYLLECYFERHDVKLMELLIKVYPEVEWETSYDKEFAKKNTFVEKLDLIKIIQDLEEYNFHKLIEEVLKVI